VRLGKTYGDLMVDVRPTNEKLRGRARRIVAQAAGCDERVAATALDDAGGRTRVAIVHLLTGVSIAAAAELTDSHDSLRAAVDAGRV
jgi:N-acetylmuramic acid 6-phosphate etherase